MLSYTSRRNLFGNLSGKSDSTTLTFADILLNNADRRLLSSRDWPFLERTTPKDTVASQQFYTLPNNIKLKDLYVTVGTTRYTPEEITSRDTWDKLNEMTYTSDFPEYFFVFNGTVGLWPTPATSGNDITLIYKKLPKDLSKADFTTGTVITTVVGDATVTGSGTSWTVPMAGSWLRVTGTDTANTGDHQWYEIDSVTSTTVLELVRPWEGTAITAGSATYIISELSLIPEAHQMVPLYDALRIYFSSANPDQSRFAQYDQLYKEGFRLMSLDAGNKTTSPVLDDGQKRVISNPNLHITA